MGLNPALILGGILAMAAIAIIGLIARPEKTTEIFGFCGVITGTLLLMLKAESDKKQLQQQMHENSQRTIERFEQSDEKTETEAAKVKEAVAGSATKTVAQVTKATEKVIEALPKVIEETVPKVLPPGNEK